MALCGCQRWADCVVTPWASGDRAQAALCAHGLSWLRVQAAGVRRFGAPQCDERVRTRAGALLGSSWLGSARRARAWTRRGGAARAGTAAALSWRAREPGAGRWRAARGAGRCAPSSCRAGVCGEEDRAGSGVLRGRSGVQGWRVRVGGVAGSSARQRRKEGERGRKEKGKRGKENGEKEKKRKNREGKKKSKNGGKEKGRGRVSAPGGDCGRGRPRAVPVARARARGGGHTRR